MAVQKPNTSQGWELRGLGDGLGWDTLVWSPSQKLRQVGPTDVLVKFHASSLNYRDLAITKGTYPFLAIDGVIPGSDGAGEVVEVGERVTRFQPGDKVLTFLFQTDYFSGASLSPGAIQSSLGGAVDGTLRHYGIFDQEGLVRMPSRLTYEQGSALPGAYLTAWNILTGGARPVRIGDCVLVQGSGGVSVAVFQLAVAAGALVIATTSSEEKAAKLTDLGANHVINYAQDAHWGATAKKLSPGGLGCSHVVDVIGRPDSFRESLDAVALGGEIQVVGFLDTANGQGLTGPTFLDALLRCCTVRGIASGSRQQLEELTAAMQSSNIIPVIDGHVFDLSDLKAAYQYLDDHRHFGKVVVKVN